MAKQGSDSALEAVVVGCRAASPGESDKGFLERARGLAHVAEAHGGMMIALDASSVYFAWNSSVFDLALAFVDDLRPLAEPAGWALGVAEGSLEAFAASGARAQFSWGKALVRASRLAHEAEAGEVLVDERLRAYDSATLRRSSSVPAVAVRCQAAIRRCVVLVAAGNVEEALLAGLDALARAREGGDEKGTLASLALLAKVFLSASRPDEAELLVTVASAPR